MTRTPELTDTAALLDEVFPGGRIGDPAYLRWLYEASPFGRVIESNRFGEQGLSAHYAVVPVDLVADGVALRGALSLNTAVSERARGGGVFVQLATETFDAARAAGIDVVVGVANANSTPGFERRLAFVNHGPLPVQVLVPVPGRASGGAIESVWAADSMTALDDAERILAVGPRGLTRRWTRETLRWRLSSPGARYALHRSHDLVAVTASERGPGGVPVALILGVFATGPLIPSRLHALTRAACRFHRAPVALHAGFNARAPFNGVPLPERFRPSPLNLISRGLSGRSLPAASRFEFIDFDAY